jgi:pyrrolidone-carboxylate peptidase
VFGQTLSTLEDGGPDEVFTTVDAVTLADAIGGEITDDPGRYVCNAWVYRVSRSAQGRVVGFVHVPPEGMDSEALLKAIGRLFGNS